MLSNMNKDEFYIFDFMLGISESLDLISPALNNHQKKVAYISYMIAKEMGLGSDEISDIIIAAILHDIGAFSLQERLTIVGKTNFEHLRLYEHAFAGYMLLKSFEPLRVSAEMVRYHHEVYSAEKSCIPRGSFIIGLADNIAVSIDDEREILEQTDEIVSKIKKGSYWPEALEAFVLIAKREYFWIDISSVSLGPFALQQYATKKIIGLDTLLSFSKVIAQIIDFRSRFTATHTSGVAVVAYELTKICGFSERESTLMLIAGYLHDLGKLAIPSEILEKPGPLDSSEMNIMRKHTYFTYLVLSRIKGLEDVAMWAAYHHERPSGDGYPFHIQGKDLTKLCRVMAVADIFTAITEDRPYRKGMSNDAAMGVLKNMANANSVDSSLVKVVEDNFDYINNIRIEAQNKALRDYEEFMEQLKQ